MTAAIPRDPFPFMRHLTLAEIVELQAREFEAKQRNTRLPREFWERLGELRLRKIRLLAAPERGNAA